MWLPPSSRYSVAVTPVASSKWCLHPCQGKGSRWQQVSGGYGVGAVGGRCQSCPGTSAPWLWGSGWLSGLAVTSSATSVGRQRNAAGGGCRVSRAPTHSESSAPFEQCFRQVPSCLLKLKQLKHPSRWPELPWWLRQRTQGFVPGSATHPQLTALRPALLRSHPQPASGQCLRGGPCEPALGQQRGVSCLLGMSLGLLLIGDVSGRMK